MYIVWCVVFWEKVLLLTSDVLQVLPISGKTVIHQYCQKFQQKTGCVRSNLTYSHNSFQSDCPLLSYPNVPLCRPAESKRYFWRRSIEEQYCINVVFVANILFAVSSLSFSFLREQVIQSVTLSCRCQPVPVCALSGWRGVWHQQIWDRALRVPAPVWTCHATSVRTRWPDIRVLVRDEASVLLAEESHRGQTHGLLW